MAKQLPHVWHRPTGEIDDPWAWLVNRDDPDTLAYLDAENCYAEAWFGDRQAMVDEIFDEIRGRIAEDDISAPTPTGEWWYSARTIEGQSYPIYGRGRSADTADTHVIVDLNAEAVGHDYCALGALDPSPDHRLIAWSIDISGDERYTLRVRDAASGIDRDDTIPGTSRGGVAWSADARFVFYVIADDQDRPYQVMRHELGTAVTDDVVVYVEDDERFFVGIGATRSNAWIVIHSGSKTSSEVRLIPTDDPTSDARVVLERQDDHDYSIDDWGDRFVIVTNRDGVDFGVMTAPSDHPDQWSELVPPRAGQRVVGIEPFADYLAVHEWVDAQPQIRIITRDGAERVLDIDPEPHDLDIGSNEIWDTTTLRLVHQSLTQPARVIDVDVTTGDYEVVKTTPTPNIDLDNYVASRHQATAPDGTLVPVDLVHHVDTPLDGTAPVCVYVYGSYEASLPPWFSAARLSLLDRGWVWALAHPRGGGELGRQWYLDGKLLAKRNTFTDTLAVSDSLCRTRHCPWWSPNGRSGVILAASPMRPISSRIAPTTTPWRPPIQPSW